jgi:cold shock CspA family protein
MYKSKISIQTGVVADLKPNFGNGGVGHIVDEAGTKFFFHSSYVLENKYHLLKKGDSVMFKPIGARKAMGACPQARDISIP